MFAARDVERTVEECCVVVVLRVVLWGLADDFVILEGRPVAVFVKFASAFIKPARSEDIKELSTEVVWVLSSSQSTVSTAAETEGEALDVVVVVKAVTLQPLTVEVDVVQV